MAIQTTHSSTKFGITLNESYHKINNVMIINKMVNYEIEIYASLEAKNLGATPVNSFFVNGVPFSEISTFEGEDILAKLYNLSKQIVQEYIENKSLIDV
jgi:hypothetical protein